MNWSFSASMAHGKRFACENCGKAYKWKESLFKHRRVECGKLPQFACEVCGHRFMHKHHLFKHMKSIHQLARINGNDPLLFQFDVLFGVPPKAIRMERIRVPKERNCEERKKINSLRILHGEGKKRSGTPGAPRFAKGEYSGQKSFVCQLCGKAYVWKVSLCRHLREECGKPPQFICGYCGKRFKQRSSFQRHVINQHVKLSRMQYLSEPN
ncbi:hypothetical protein KM043_007703 [Ampulex compressa]|nr:hypothetical protein KM043_007703 [Ampulex compressa]